MHFMNSWNKTLSHGRCCSGLTLDVVRLMQCSYLGLLAESVLKLHPLNYFPPFCCSVRLKTPLKTSYRGFDPTVFLKLCMQTQRTAQGSWISAPAFACCIIALPYGIPHTFFYACQAYDQKTKQKKKKLPLETMPVAHNHCWYHHHHLRVEIKSFQHTQGTVFGYKACPELEVLAFLLVSITVPLPKMCDYRIYMWNTNPRFSLT